MAGTKSKRGFAAMDKAQRQAIARKGGQASGGNPGNLTTEARAKGGRNSHRNTS